jgi:uncharacterized membrane protein
MLYTTLKLLHLLSIIVWLGGMVFSLFFLRPAVVQLELAPKLQLMHAALGRFLRAAMWSATLVLGTGSWMIGRVAKQTVQAGGSFAMPLSWTIMAALGVLMVLVLGHIRFALFKRLDRAVVGQDWAAGAVALDAIKRWVSINLAIGVVIVAVALLV